MRMLLLMVLAGFAVGCSTLPRPGEGAPLRSAEAREILRDSAKRQGDAWRNARRVTVAYEGRWSAIATRLQPVLTDPGFRKGSEEVYEPRLERVRQVHRGPAGVKEVVREKGSVRVVRNGVTDDNRDSLAAAALVADAYTAFLFGSSWLADVADEVWLLPDDESTRDGQRLVGGRLRPGFGFSGEDHFIAWIDEKDGSLRRLQFTLGGMESTKGADVDVVFSEFVRDSNGFLWPQRFVEDIQRPLKARAHEWETIRLRAER